MTKRGPDSVTFALEEVIRMEDERLEEERLEQERKEAEAKEKKLKEQKRREFLAQAVKEAKKQEKETVAKANPAARIPREEEFIFREDITPLRWYQGYKFKRAIVAIFVALGIVVFIRYRQMPIAEKEFEEIPEHVTIQEYEELEAKFEYLEQKIDRLADKIRENEGIANEKHLQIYNRVGLYDIRAHERMDKLENIIDKLNKPKETKRYRRKTKKEQPKPKKKHTGPTDNPMGELELLERR